MLQRPVIFAVLVIVSLSSIFSIANVQSQTMTTFTSYEASTSPVTSTSVGYVTVGTAYTTSPVLLYSGPFTINAAGTAYGCWYEHFPFSGIGGQVLSININANRAISFYVMTENAYNKWIATNQCVMGVLTLFTREGIQSLQYNLAIPYNSTFEFLFLNFDKVNSATVEFDVGYVGQSASTTMASTILALTTQTVTSQAPVTATETGVLTYSASSTELTNPPTLPSLTPYLVVVVIAIIGIVALLYFRSGNRRAGRQQTKLSQFAKTGKRKNRGGQFCPECGAQLPIGAKFCKECGSKQA